MFINYIDSRLFQFLNVKAQCDTLNKLKTRFYVMITAFVQIFFYENSLLFSVHGQSYESSASSFSFACHNNASSLYESTVADEHFPAIINEPMAPHSQRNDPVSHMFWTDDLRLLFTLHRTQSLTRATSLLMAGDSPTGGCTFRKKINCTGRNFSHHKAFTDKYDLIFK